MKINKLCLVVLITVVCCKKQKSLEEEMTARQCISEKYDSIIRSVDSTSLIQRYYHTTDFKPSHDGFIKVVRNGYEGIIDTLGREVIGLKYFDIISYSNFKVGNLGRDSKDLIYIDNKTIYTCRCQEIQKLNSNLFRIKKEGNYGLLDSLGRELLPPIYGIIYGIGDNGLVSTYLSEKGGGIVNLNNEVILPFKYGRVWGFGNRKVTPIENENFKWAIVNEKGNFKTSFMYDYISPYNKTQTATVIKGTKKGLINRFGELIVKPKYDKVLNYSGDVKKTENIYYMPIQLNEKWGIVTSTGKELVPPIYSKRVNLSLPTSVKRNGFWTFLNKKGKEVIPSNFDSILYPKNDIVGVKKNNKWGFVTKSGDVLSDCKYNRFHSLSKAKYSCVTRNNKFNILNRKGEFFATDLDSVKLDFRYTKYGFVVSRNRKWGVVDSLGKQKIPFKYDDVGFMRFKNSYVKKDSKYGIISYKGKMIVPFKYDYIGEFEEFHIISAPVKLNNKWGRIDINGKIIVPIIHSSIKKVEVSICC